MKYRRIPYKVREVIILLFPVAAKTLGVLAGVCATVFAFIDIAGGVLSFSLVLYLSIIMLIASAAVSFFYLRAAHLPEIIIFEEGKDDKYVLKYADESSERIINSFSSNYYGEFYVEDDEVETWREKNPNGFLTLYNKHNQPCGGITILGIENGFMNSLIKGSVSDLDLNSDKVLSFEDSKQSATLYITGIIVLEPLSTIGRKRALALIWGVVQYLKKYYISSPPKKIYAIAITKESENLLRKLDFQVEGIKNKRIDRHTLFSLAINKDNLNRILNRIGDYSSLCKIQI